MKQHTLQECYDAGVRHRAYNWAQSPWGHWNDEQMAAYLRGFNGEPFLPGVETEPEEAK